MQTVTRLALGRFESSSSHGVLGDVTDTNGLRLQGKMVHVSNLPPIPLEHKPASIDFSAKSLGPALARTHAEWQSRYIMHAKIIRAGNIL
jgi:hypothetical protein